MSAARLGARVHDALDDEPGGHCGFQPLPRFGLGHPKGVRDLTPIWELILGGVLIGAGITFAFASMANLIVDAVPQFEVGIATGINTVMRTVGGSFGAAIATAILAGSAGAGGFPTEGAYTAAFAFSAVAGFAAVGAALLVPRPQTERAATSPLTESP